ncbi:histidine phosphatase family protein [Enterococcus sp. BWM-S5]|uniref:phosphoglycerate mutase (2,3-diphosphoglycerate-dependent) n=1 Tax=Enterococcus larvae TaxID=2794352 RepID=A0ABS4CPA3_9ENTE|nr:histidine phosphatase family protein [Enterococcus larvae]MBP1047966.1 histidine phosphatase family protein [Enterococcus larvae]
MNVKKLLVGMAAAVFLTGCAGGADKAENTVESTTPANGEVTIYFARHGKTMLNTVDRSQGWIDAPLTPAGIEVAEYLGKGLKEADITFDKVYTSSSGRTMETAELILENNGQKDMEYTRDKRLREYNFGTYEGMMNEEMQSAVAEADGKTYEEFMEDMQTDGFYKSILHFADVLAELDKENVEEGVNWAAEDSQTIVDRLTAALDDIVADAEKEGHSNVLVVSHGMSIITLLGHLDSEAELPPTGLKNASISTVTYKDGKYSVGAVNDMTYVENGEKE